MRLLIDTHIALWAITDDPSLPKRAREWIADPSNEIFVSAATVWEISIKHALGPNCRGAILVSGTTALARFTAAGYLQLGVTSAHAAAVDGLTPHHADPFDRLLIAQSQVEQLWLVTHDSVLAAYGETVHVV